MKVDIREKNTALVSLFENPGQTIFLDANFLIPPDRSRIDKNVKPVPFQKYCEIWLDPIFDEFSGFAMHESVYDELVKDNVKLYADSKKQKTPPRLKVYTDSGLNAVEMSMMETYIQKIAPYSKYIPSLGNADDRGEVLSLSYMAAKGFLYFASDDKLPFDLIRKAEEFETGLDNMGLLEMYDVIFYLYRSGKYDNKGLRMLYKYQYHLTKKEKSQNPEWGEFIEKMTALYQ